MPVAIPFVPRPASGTVIVFVHGAIVTGHEMFLLRGRMERLGYGVRQFHWKSITAPLEYNLDLLARFIAETEADTLHVVGHSMGGVLARLVFERAPDPRPGRIVAIGSPLTDCWTGRKFGALHPALPWLAGVTVRDYLAKDIDPDMARHAGVRRLGGDLSHWHWRALSQPAFAERRSRAARGDEAAGDYRAHGVSPESFCDALFEAVRRYGGAVSGNGLFWRPPLRLHAAQCRKCRWPVKTMAMPRSSAAAITFGSLTLPPGWMAAVAPASAAASRPSGKGKKASDAMMLPCSGSLASPAFQTAMREESMRDIWPAPTPSVRSAVA